MFPSGRWRGFWESPLWGRRWMEPLTLQFAAGRVRGEGVDCIGPFTFAGTYSDDGVVQMTKQYIGRHWVRYEGRVEGEGAIVGRWFIPPVSSGAFGFSPEIDVSQLPITPLGEPE